MYVFTCVLVCLYVKPVSRSKDCLVLNTNWFCLMFELYIPVRPSVPEMEGIYVRHCGHPF